MIEMRVRRELFRNQYLARYLRCRNKTEKNLFLTEICTVFGYNRKYAIRKIHGEQMRCAHSSPRPKRNRKYDAIFVNHAIDLWYISGHMCAEHLHQYIADNLEYVVRRKYLCSDSRTMLKLRQVSIGTLKRVIREYKWQHHIGRGISTTKSNPRLQKQIPLRTTNWDITAPGWHETDYVSHCGDTNQGTYLHTLHFTDITSGWTSLRAVPYANQQSTFHAFQEIECRLPYPLRGINPDNGSEFINFMLWKYYQSRPRIEYTRSRPYQKNDNAVVERKNFTIVRKYTGYYRYESDQARYTMTLLYQRLELFLNFFQPVHKVVKVQVMDGKVKTARDTSQTPFARLMKSSAVSATNKQQLQNIRDRLDPVQLMKDIQKLKQQLMALRHT